MFNYMEPSYIFAYMNGNKFKKCGFDELENISPDYPLYVAPAKLEDIAIGFKPHNVKSVHGIPMVVRKEGVEQFSKEYLDIVIKSWCMTKTYSRALDDESYQIMMPVDFGFADRHAAGHIVHELYKKYPAMFLTTYPAINDKLVSFVDVPGYGQCRLQADNSDKVIKFNNFLDSWRAAGIDIPYSVLDDVTKRETKFYSKSFMIKGPTGDINISYLSVCNSFVNICIDMVKNYGYAPQDADKELTGAHLKHLKNDYLNAVLSVIGMGLHFGDLEYRDTYLEQETVTGKEFEYNVAQNKWRERGAAAWEIAMMYPKCYGEWRALWFLGQAVQFKLPNLFLPKYKQVQDFKLQHGYIKDDTISYLEEKYYADITK